MVGREDGGGEKMRGRERERERERESWVSEGVGGEVSSLLEGCGGRVGVRTWMYGCGHYR